MIKLIDGTLDGRGLRIGVVMARFNAVIGDRLLEGALATLAQNGVPDGNVTVVRVPGAFEIPQAARVAIESGTYDAVICLGAVVRGETPHFDFVAAAAAEGIAELNRAGRVPVVFGLLTTNTMNQAMERSGGKAGNKGADAAAAALEMVHVLRAVQRAGRT
ncbi:MAG: 6,7-dimethyl-8-ribityllumazine synthase [Planctomycetes bacterium]|nr:6,7-dimethyl-8-ribityllumazine synthase [Planctomycetota bacterium]